MKTILILFGLLLSTSGLSIYSQSATPIQGTCSVWEKFVKAQKDNKPTTLLDFSYAGYRHAEIAPPEVNHPLFNVCDYGAIPNDRSSDREAIQRAIAAAEKSGSGIIYFPKGRFQLHAQGDPHRPIFIKGSHIVFRGEGAGADGTELFMEMPNEPVNPEEKWTSPSLFCFTGGGYAATLTRVVGNATRGSFTVRVENTLALKPGDWICLRLRNNTQEMIDKELSPYQVEAEWSSLFINGVIVNDYHQIASIKGNRVTFKEPIMHAVEAAEGWTIQTFPHLEEIGVESLAFVGNWKDEFIHHKDWLHDGGYKFIEYRNVVNAWIRACRFTDVSEAATVNSSANVSIFDCTVTGTLGHNSFHSQGASRVFMGAIDDQPSQWHSVGVAKPALGTVIWRVLTQANSCFESHASQPRATLFDACEGGFMEGRSGGAIFNAPNHLRDLVFWNYKELDKGTKDFSFWPANNRWFKFMPPIIVGFHGAGTTFLPTEVEYEESNGQPVNPESLFEAQLTLRLGKLPQWVVELKEKMANKQLSGALEAPRTIEVNSVSQLEQAALRAKAGDVLLLADGTYKDVQLSIEASGTFTSPISIRANPTGKVSFAGDVRVDLRGNHIILDGICFENGLRDSLKWEETSHGLVTIYGDYCRVTKCRFLAFDNVHSAYIATAIGQLGNTPRYAHIDHCSFIGKSSQGEMIGFNHATVLSPDSTTPASALYHQVEFCYFSNPEGKNNVPGGIRIGSNGTQTGRCTIANNLFERVDSDVIMSEAKENVFYNNTFKNCQGTLNLRYGERQVVLNNFFLGTDLLNEYGGMDVCGSNHLIGCNYFNLPRTLTAKGGAAIRFQSGEGRTTAAHIALIKNIFIDVARCNVSFVQPTEPTKKSAEEGAHDICLLGNLFFATHSPHSFVTDASEQTANQQLWIENLFNGIRTGVDYPIDGLQKGNASLRYDDSKTYVEDFDGVTSCQIEKHTPFQSIKGVELNFSEILKFGCCGSPLSR